MRRAVPETVGDDQLAGGPACTKPVAKLVAVTVASVFAAVTRTRMRLPTSATPST